MKIIRGSDNSIDELRDNIQTLQWDSPRAVIYLNTTKRVADVIWDLQVKPNTRIRLGKSIPPGSVIWEAVAEDMDFIEGKNILIPISLVLDEGEFYYLPKRDALSEKNKDDKTTTDTEDD
ncbi:MAG: hypothetical protein QF535_23730 [Anaerolineales bacterium]|nr:hypothetical protein [Anaerolineales bacterium]